MVPGKTYFIDVDGTIVRHLDAHKVGIVKEELLEGVKEYWQKFHDNDLIVITTARPEILRKKTEMIFQENGLRYDYLIMGLPYGPRYLINDTPDITLPKAYAINLRRNDGFYFDDMCKHEYV